MVDGGMCSLGGVSPLCPIPAKGMETWTKCGNPLLLISPSWFERGGRSESSLIDSWGPFLVGLPYTVPQLAAARGRCFHRWWLPECSFKPGARVSVYRTCYSLNFCLVPRTIHPLPCLERSWQRTTSTSSLQWQKAIICSTRYTWREWGRLVAWIWGLCWPEGEWEIRTWGRAKHGRQDEGC